MLKVASARRLPTEARGTCGRYVCGSIAQSFCASMSAAQPLEVTKAAPASDCKPILYVSINKLCRCAFLSKAGHPGVIAGL